MSAIRMQIDGKEVDAQNGMTVLAAAKQAGIDIPTLCHHEKLAPFGGCRSGAGGALAASWGFSSLSWVSV